MLADLRFALRMMAKSRSFTIVALATVAIGVGVNTALFAAVRAVFLRPFPYPDGERIVRLWQSTGPGWEGSVSEENFTDWRARASTITELSAVSNDSFNLAADSPERVEGQHVTGSFFRVFGLHPALGRTFVPEELQLGHERSVVLSHGLWRRAFGGDPRIVGRSIDLSGKSYTVVGVMPPEFVYPGGLAELWVPLPLERKLGRGNTYLAVMGRLASGASIQAARAELDGIARALAQTYPDTNTNSAVLVRPLREYLSAPLRDTAVVLMLAVVFVLAIGCANIANLLLARAAARRNEIAVRVALGAGRARVVRQLFTESLLLALGGGGLGLVVALFVRDALAAALPAEARALFAIRLDAAVLAFAALAALVSALAFGLAPALGASRADLSVVLKEGSTRTVAARNRSKDALVVAEVALSLVLLVGAALLLRSLGRLADVPIGFDPRHLLTMRIALPDGRYADDRARAAFHRTLLEQVEALPGVRSAAVVNFLPFEGDNSNGGFEIVGRPQPPPGQVPWTEQEVVSPGYFRTLGIAITRGRGFTSADGAAPGAVIVNETFVRRYLSGLAPVGQHLRINGAGYEIVGVVADVRRFGRQRSAPPEFFFPLGPWSWKTMTLVVRTAGEPQALAAAVRGAVRTVDPHQAVFAVQTMNDIVAGSLSLRRFVTGLLAVFAAVALLLASLGIYGVMAYYVSQRTQELGVRMALGARAEQVQRMVMREGMILCLLGLLIGIAGAALASGLLRALVFGVTTSDWLSYAAAALSLLAVGALACWLPARRATRIDPMIALRAS